MREGWYPSPKNEQKMSLWKEKKNLVGFPIGFQFTKERPIKPSEISQAQFLRNASNRFHAFRPAGFDFFPYDIAIFLDAALLDQEEPEFVIWGGLSTMALVGTRDAALLVHSNSVDSSPMKSVSRIPYGAILEVREITRVKLPGLIGLELVQDNTMLGQTLKLASRLSPIPGLIGDKTLFMKQDDFKAQQPSITELRSRVSGRKTSAPPLSKSIKVSVSEELERLVALRESGVLSEEEFQTAKGQVLGS